MSMNNWDRTAFLKIKRLEIEMQQKKIEKEMEVQQNKLEIKQMLAI